MNLQNVFTKMDKFLQEHLKIWDYKIPSHFPDNLDKTAAQSGALQRKRGIHSVYDLLKLFFLYACSSLSFRVMGQPVRLEYPLFLTPPYVKVFQRQRLFSIRFSTPCCQACSPIQQVLCHTE